jgi:hypothetical protein
MSARSRDQGKAKPSHKEHSQSSQGRGAPAESVTEHRNPQNPTPPISEAASNSADLEAAATLIELILREVKALRERQGAGTKRKRDPPLHEVEQRASYLLRAVKRKFGTADSTSTSDDSKEKDGDDGKRDDEGENGEEQDGQDSDKANKDGREQDEEDDNQASDEDEEDDEAQGDETRRDDTDEEQDGTQGKDKTENGAQDEQEQDDDQQQDKEEQHEEEQHEEEQHEEVHDERDQDEQVYILSDADPSFRLTDTALAPDTDYVPIYVENLQKLWLKDGGDPAQQIGLPAGYEIVTIPRKSTRGKPVDRYLYGHPGWHRFESVNTFYPHLKYLINLTNGTASRGSCTCKYCGKASKKPVTRERSPEL